MQAAVGALKLVAFVMLSVQMAYCVQDPNIAKMNNLTAISILLDHLPESAREWVRRHSLYWISDTELMLFCSGQCTRRRLTWDIFLRTNIIFQGH